MQISKDEFVSRLDEVLKKVECLNFTDLDREVNALKEAYDILYEHSIFTLHLVSSEEQEEAKYEFFSKITELSGTLSFLAIQHFAANKRIFDNEFEKKDHYIKRKNGVAVNHLRAPNTVVSGEKVDGGYILNGVLTWASGYGIFDTLLVGFHYEDSEVVGTIDFKEQNGLSIGECDDTFVGYGMNTVNIELKDFFIGDDSIVFTKPKGDFTKGKSISKTIHYAIIGIANAAIFEIKDEEFKSLAKKELDSLVERILEVKDGKVLDKLRIKLFNLALKIITTGMILNGGKSILASTKLQRFYRELIMFNSNGLNSEIKALFKAEAIADI